ncbi:MAG: hypothetical protein M5U25_16560 [Planctomycetota bacterium]|nr:hypothetical protein [Planctomycetota bacterium]
MLLTIGAVLSMVYTWPEVNAPPMLLPAVSEMVAPTGTSSRIVPSPLPVFTVTVRVVPVPETPVTDAPEMEPVVVSEKSPVATPETSSLKVTVNPALDALEGLVPVRTILVTVGAVLSMVYDCPEVYGRLVTFGVTPVEFCMSSLMVPLPLPVETVTVLDVPLPETPVTEAPLTPVVLNVKFDVATPDTETSKLTVKLTDDALVGVLPVRLMEVTIEPDGLPLTIKDSRRDSLPPVAAHDEPPLVDLREPSVLVCECSQNTQSDAVDAYHTAQYVVPRLSVAPPEMFTVRFVLESGADPVPLPSSVPGTPPELVRSSIVKLPLPPKIFCAQIWKLVMSTC